MNFSESPVRLLCKTVSFWVVLAGLTSCLAQDANEARKRVNSNFERNSPAVGERIPDIKVYGSRGEPFAIDQMKGPYTVLIFGCLT